MPFYTQMNTRISRWKPQREIRRLAQNTLANGKVNITPSSSSSSSSVA
jgi:hypothetical protein